MDDCASHLIPKEDASHPLEETHFIRLYSQNHSFCHDPSFMTIGEGRNEDWAVDQELYLLAQLSFCHNGAVKWAAPSNAKSIMLFTSPLALSTPIRTPFVGTRNPKNKITLPYCLEYSKISSDEPIKWLSTWQTHACLICHSCEHMHAHTHLSDYLIDKHGHIKPYSSRLLSRRRKNKFPKLAQHECKERD